MKTDNSERCCVCIATMGVKCFKWIRCTAVHLSGAIRLNLSMLVLDDFEFIRLKYMCSTHLQANVKPTSRFFFLWLAKNSYNFLIYTQP